jgi:hypothetical protein
VRDQVSHPYKTTGKIIVVYKVKILFYLTLSDLGRKKASDLITFWRLPGFALLSLREGKHVGEDEYAALVQRHWQVTTEVIGGKCINFGHTKSFMEQSGFEPGPLRWLVDDKLPQS